MAVSVNIKGFKELEKSLKEFGKEGQAVALDVTFTTATEIEGYAKKAAPKDIGKLAQSIRSIKVENEVKYKVQANEPYAAFVEFGTGAKVSIPSGWEDIAADFRNKPGGTYEEGLANITRWCQKKGIDVKKAKFIFFLILKNGMAAQPFMYPAFIKGKKTFYKDLKHRIKQLTKDFNG